MRVPALSAPTRLDVFLASSGAVRTRSQAKSWIDAGSVRVDGKARKAGFVLAGALIGRGDRTPLGDRLRAVGADICIFVFGFAVMLVWAGIVEAFLSQYHHPVIPYAAKIAFGVLELVLLIFLLARDRPEDGAEET